MYNKYDIAQWSDAHKRLKEMSVHCPSCGVLQEPDAEQLDGIALNLERSKPDNHVFSNVRFNAFIHAKYPHKGYVVTMCDNCSTRFVVEVGQYAYESGRVVWPLPGVKISDDIPEPVRTAVVDAKRARAVNSITGATMSIRTAVERIQRQQAVSNLSELWEKGQLPSALFDTANEPRLWGNVVGHEDFDPAQITEQHVDELLTFLDQLLYLLYEMPAKLDRARESREAIEGQEEEK